LASEPGAERGLGAGRRAVPKTLADLCGAGQQPTFSGLRAFTRLWSCAAGRRDPAGTAYAVFTHLGSAECPHQQWRTV